MTNRHSLTKQGPEDLIGNNYFNTIFYNNQPVINLWAFDSNEDNCLGIKGWGCIDSKAINYFK